MGFLRAGQIAQQVRTGWSWKCLRFFAVSSLNGGCLVTPQNFALSVRIAERVNCFAAGCSLLNSRLKCRVFAAGCCRSEGQRCGKAACGF